MPKIAKKFAAASALVDRNKRYTIAEGFQLLKKTVDARATKYDQTVDVAINLGVPRDKILIENKSTNTGENILFTRRLLAEKELDPEKFILVQKPYMERRAYATFRKFWPEKKVLVTSPRVSFEEYLKEYKNEKLSSGDVISIMVGDLQRIKLYPEKGYQIHQEIPGEIWAAYEELVRTGYDKYLVPT